LYTYLGCRARSSSGEISSLPMGIRSSCIRGQCGSRHAAACIRKSRYTVQTFA
jgi:hypothetical protein